jgi:hypothetical protein
VTCISTGGRAALVGGYSTAIEYATSHGVRDAHGEVGDAMRATGTLDKLADSDDAGALLLAVPVGGSPT